MPYLDGHESATPPETAQMESRPPDRFSSWLLLLWLLPLIAAMVALGVLALRQLPDKHDVAETQDAYFAAKRFVQDNFQAGIALRFAPRENTNVSRDGDNYVVTAWVEAIKADGTNSQVYEYSCTEFRNLDGEWFPAKVNLAAQ